MQDEVMSLRNEVERLREAHNAALDGYNSSWRSSAVPSWRSMAPMQSNGRSVGSPYFAPVQPDGLENLDRATYGFPIRVNDVSVNARGAVAIDSTRLDTAASGSFLPSAIPVFGEPFYGLGQRTSVQGQGSSVGLSWLAEVGAPVALTGGFRVELLSAGTSDVNVITPQAWVQWDRLLFGISDSAFTDVDAIPDTVDINGPNGRPWIRSGQAQIRYAYLTPYDPATEPTGFYGNVSVESPSPDIYLPTGQGYSTFSRFPDSVATIRYQRGVMEKNECTQASVYDEFWHVQAGAIVRDLGVERVDGSVRETQYGWGTQLSGRYTIFRTGSCGEEFRDYFIVSATYGEGLGHYFNDLRAISSVNDAAYDRNTNELSALPVFAYFVAYQHDWTERFRSTAVYSRIHLDSRQIPGGNTVVLPYESGDYISCNLMFHAEPCTINKPPLKNVQHNLFAGMEYLYGQKENLAGDSGEAHRVMFVIAATK